MSDLTPPVDTSPVGSTPSPDDGTSLGADWDEAFSWSYGRRLWNVGCG
jgi:hypothetical protein